MLRRSAGAESPAELATNRRRIFVMEQHDDTLDLVRRAVAHYRDDSTDQAESTMEIPVEVYLDADRFHHEVDQIFGHLPLALALSLELPEPHSYRSLTVMDTPVLLTRDETGTARAFLNVCRHRGSILCQSESGTARGFTCPYHGWSYNIGGELDGMFGAAVFGDVNRSERGLTELRCAERSGFIWVSLDPASEFDIDDWLGDFAAELDTLDLENWHLVEQRDLVGSLGWKVAWDGYLESYHHKYVHAETLGKHTVSNLLLHDAYGPHQRLVLARKEVADIVDLPEEQWENLPQYIRQIHSGFPNLSISGILGDHALVTQVYPGPTPDTTVTRQTVLAGKAPTNPEEEAATAAFSEMTLTAVRDEDYAVGAMIQQALPSGANTEFIFGRNEIALQHYHRYVAHFAHDAVLSH
jgi:phenylpropionate dioxygenase-like ring-hydroxylating dioxygenase large terminal subunit